MRSILLIDDDDQITDVLSLVLESEGYRFESCSTPEAARRLVGERNFSLVLLDLRLGEHDGLELLPELRELDPDVPIFIITAHGDIDSAIQGLTEGASGYIRKPFEEGDLKTQIAQSIEGYELRCGRKSRESRESMNEEAPETDVRGIIQSRDPAMEPVLRQISVAAHVRSNVLVTGESGVGKELVARALHRCGPRRSEPFVAFNCAALPEQLLESELFGYARGAFTDARENKPGLFVRANRGTIFIDEIGDAPLSIQAKLLRVLQEREILPVGGIQPIKIDVRVIAATHRDLRAEIAAGRFRQDLFYRLHVIPIHVPALRERPRDIVFLAHLFAQRFSSELGIEFECFTPGAVRALETREWPGNIRELQNRIERSIVLGRGPRINAQTLFPEAPAPVEEEPELEQLPAVIAPPAPEDMPTFQEAKQSFERTYLERLLSLAKGNITKAARLAAKSRTEVYGLLRKHSLDPVTYKEGGPTPF